MSWEEKLSAKSQDEREMFLELGNGMRKVGGGRSMLRQLLIIQRHDRCALWPSLGHFLPSPDIPIALS